MTIQIITTSYNGVPVEFDYAGWFNATKAAKRYGKRPNDWLRLSSTVEYIRTLREVAFRSEEIPLLKVVRGGRGKGDITWMHPDLAVVFARWLNTRFAIWCDVTIKRILHGEASIMSKSADAPSTAADREPLAINVTKLIFQQGLPCGAAWRAANDYAGVPRARKMRCGQVEGAAEFTGRLLSHSATPADFKRMESNGISMRGEVVQLGLFPAESGDE